MLPMASTGDLLSDVFGQVGALHPRFHGPAVGGRPVPEDVDVNLVGCFAESQFAEAELKYYGSQNGASFGPMFWHARDDGVPYFAMARHDEPLGHGFTFRTFAHDKEQPKWGVYDGCGAPCNDDEARYCGCAGEGNRGFGSSECDEGEKRFAVYRIAPNRTLAEAAVPSLSNASNASGAANATSALAAASAQHSRPHWRLSEEAGDVEKPSIEIVLPAGGEQVILESKGHQAVVINASDASAAPAPTTPQQAPSADAGAGAATSQASTATAAPAKVKLPMGVDPQSCDFQAPTGDADASQKVLKCKVDESEVRKIPIKVIDEL